MGMLFSKAQDETLWDQHNPIEVWIDKNLIVAQALGVQESWFEEFFQAGGWRGGSDPLLCKW